MEPFLRQAALETLLDHSKEIKPVQLAEALKLGLTDPDFQVAEVAWKFVKKNLRLQEFKTELTELAERLNAQKDDYSRKLALVIAKALQPLTPQ